MTLDFLHPALRYLVYLSVSLAAGNLSSWCFQICPWYVFFKKGLISCRVTSLMFQMTHRRMIRRGKLIMLKQMLLLRPALKSDQIPFPVQDLVQRLRKVSNHLEGYCIQISRCVTFRLIDSKSTYEALRENIYFPL